VQLQQPELLLSSLLSSLLFSLSLLFLLSLLPVLFLLSLLQQPEQQQEQLRQQRKQHQQKQQQREQQRWRTELFSWVNLLTMFFGESVLYIAGSVPKAYKSITARFCAGSLMRDESPVSNHTLNAPQHTPNEAYRVDSFIIRQVMVPLPVPLRHYVLQRSHAPAWERESADAPASDTGGEAGARPECSPGMKPVHPNRDAVASPDAFPRGERGNDTRALF
jgi:hypothetical protein